MKNVFFYNYLVFMFIISGCSESSNDLIKNKIKGKVNKITESRYSATEKFGELKKEKQESLTISTYNTKGYIIEKFEKGFNGFDDETRIYEYKNNKLLKINVLDQNKKTKQTYIYDYNENGRLIKWRNILSDNEILQYETYSYDEKGFLIESTSYKKDGSISSKSKLTNDFNGNCIERKFYEYDAVFETHKQKYDSKNNLIEREIEMYNNLISKTTYKYNNDKLVEEVSLPTLYSPESSSSKYEYLNFDKKNNWTVKTIRRIYGKEHIFEIIEREYLYF
ncbi:hypothetical protein PDL71_06230 [Lacibacter sp. MH-610]|uniref:hypothetical protein n=1 Tax=Lacibacter sp. MH-610 TaxID=3020883 RepID=UPI003891ADA1